jgi:ABC-type multidrug transport system fused ATPase/permease subunit
MNVNAVLQRGLVAAKSIFALLDEVGEEGTTSSKAAAALSGLRQPISSEPAPRSVVKAPEIRFERVGFRYETTEGYALRDFSAVVPSGSSAVVVGESGSGKSTLLYLLCGFDRPTHGQIMIDGEDITQLDLRALRGRISLVGQSSMLFDLTVRENLKLANPTAGQAELARALALAGASEFVSELPYGLETRLGTLGDTLSGGQKQRLSIARAFLKNAPILLLDEPTSALDRESEQAVLQGVCKLMKDRTTIVVSHSPERLLKVDQVISL